MVYPIRMNPVDIVIKQLDRARTVVDPNFRQPTSVKVRFRQITVQGQPNFDGKAFRSRSVVMHGDEEPVDGWIVFRKQDLDNQGITINKGDQVVEVAGEPVDALISEVRPESPLRGRFLLLYAMLQMNTDARGGTR